MNTRTLKKWAMFIITSAFFSIQFIANSQSLPIPSGTPLLTYTGEPCNKDGVFNQAYATVRQPSNHTALPRGVNITFCGTYAGVSGARPGRVTLYDQAGNTVASHTSNAGGDYRWSFDHTISSCDPTQLLRTLVVEALRWGPTLSPSGEIRFGWRFVVEGVYYYSIENNITIVGPPAAQAEMICTPNLADATGDWHEIMIPNDPSNPYPKLYLIEDSAAALNIYNTILDNPNVDWDTNYLDNIASKVLVANNGGNFYLRDIFDSPRMYFMAYGTTNNCRLHLSLLSPLAVIPMPSDINPIHENYVLSECGGCDLAGVNYIPLQVYNDNLTNQILTDVTDAGNEYGLLNLSPNAVDISWHDEDFIDYETVGSVTIMKACSERIPPGPNGKRDYTMDLDISIRAELNHLNGGITLTEDLTCTVENARKVTISKSPEIPQSKIEFLCGNQTYFDFDCRDGMHGIEVWSHPTSNQRSAYFVDGVTESTYFNPNNNCPPIPKSDDYFKCDPFSITKGDKDKVDVTAKSVCDKPTYEERWRFNHNFDDQNNGSYTFYVNYVFADGSKSQRVPMVFFVVPHPDSLVSTTVELLKPDPSDSCAFLSQHILDDGLMNQDLVLNTAVSNFNTVMQGQGHQINMVKSVEWTPTEGLRDVDTLLGAKRVCYYDLPEEGGSCRTYTQVANLVFYYTLQLPCGDSIIETFSCQMPIQRRTICKKMYPPMPKVELLCEDSMTVCIDTISDYYPEFELRIVSDNPAHSDTIMIVPRCFSKPWRNFFHDYAGTMPNLLKMTVASISESERKSTAVPFFLILPPHFDTTGLNETRNVSRPVNEAPGNVGSYCRNGNQPSTYTDLDFDLNQYQADLDSVLGIINQVSLLNVSLSPQVIWDDPQYIEYIAGNPSINRVCYGNLRSGPPTQADLKGRDYFGRLYLKMTSEVDVRVNVSGSAIPPEVYNGGHYNISIDSTLRDSVSCAIVTRVVTVNKIYPEPPSNCNVSANDINAVMGATTCDNGTQDVYLSCPHDSLVIGPQGQGFLLPTDSITGYTWIEDSGAPGTLSNLHIQNPTFIQLPHVGIGEILKFVLIVDYINLLGEPDQYYYCVFVYTCPGCQGSRPSLQGSTSNNVNYIGIGQVKLFPNPTSSKATIVSTSSEIKEILIFDHLGRKIQTIQPVSPSKIFSINLESLNAGNYFVTVINSEEEKQVLQLTKIE